MALDVVDIRMKAKLLHQKHAHWTPAALEQAQSDFRQLLKGGEGSAVDGRLAVRCSKPTAVTRLSPRTVTVLGPTGPVALNVVTVEGGRLPWERAKQQRDQTA